MPIAASPVALEVRAPASTRTLDAVTLLPSRVALLERLAERTPSSDESHAALVLVGLLHRDTGWPMPGSQLDLAAAALSANLRSVDWLARSGPTEFAVLLNGSAPGPPTARPRPLHVRA